jgi:hypothetical protein
MFFILSQFEWIARKVRSNQNSSILRLGNPALQVIGGSVQVRGGLRGEYLSKDRIFGSECTHSLRGFKQKIDCKPGPDMQNSYRIFHTQLMKSKLNSKIVLSAACRKASQYLKNTTVPKTLYSCGGACLSYV